MPGQNIYDNDAFFESFRSSRDNEVNFNDCIETPILLGMLPDLHGKKVLDMIVSNKILVDINIYIIK